MLDRTTISEKFEGVVSNLKGESNPLIIGGFAMILYGLKDTTKDIDLVFQLEKEREVFQKALEERNYQIKSKNEIVVYQDPNSGLRLDLFLQKIFHANLTENMLERADKRPFAGKVINFASKEDLAVLKGLSSRERDLEDLESLLKSKGFDWRTFQKELLDQLKRLEEKEKRFCMMNVGRVLEKIGNEKTKELANRLWEML